MRTKLKPIHLFVPFERIERRDEDGAYIVEGYAFVNEVVGGEGGVRLKRSAMEAATPDYLKFGAVREMHQPIAAGTALEATWDERGCRLRAEIVDDAAIKKIERNVYKGFSVGVNPRLMRGKDVEECEWPETSLVDRPKDPDALFLHRAEGFDPEALVEVEVIDDSPSSAGSPVTRAAETVPETRVDDLPSPAAADPAAAPDPASSLSPASESSQAPSGEATPAAGASASESAAGDSSPTEEERAALIEAGLPEGMLAGVEVVQAGVEQRAQTSETVPTRENLEPKHCRAHDADCKRGCEGEECKEERAAVVAPERVAAITRELEQIVARAAELQRELSGGEQATTARMEAIVEVQPIGAMEAEAPKPRSFRDVLSGRDAQGLVNQVDMAYSALWESLSSILYSDTGSKLAKLRTSIGEYAEYLGDLVGGGVERADVDVILKRVAAVEAQHPAAPETVSRSDEREDPTELQRLTEANSELLQRLAVHEETLQRLAASEAEVKRLRALPMETEKPPVRYPHALERRFLADLGSEGEQQIAVLRADYEAAKQEAAAERNGDRDKLNRATERMILRASQLAEHGVYVT